MSQALPAAQRPEETKRHVQRRECCLAGYYRAAYDVVCGVAGIDSSGAGRIHVVTMAERVQMNRVMCTLREKLGFGHFFFAIMHSSKALVGGTKIWAYRSIRRRRRRRVGVHWDGVWCLSVGVHDHVRDGSASVLSECMWYYFKSQYIAFNIYIV